MVSVTITALAPVFLFNELTTIMQNFQSFCKKSFFNTTTQCQKFFIFDLTEPVVEKHSSLG